MPDRDRTAVDVEFVVRNAEFALGVQRLAGEGLVDLDESVVVDLAVGALEQALGRGDRADAMMVGSTPAT